MTDRRTIGVVDPVTIGIIAKAVLSFIKFALPIWLKAKESLDWDRAHQLLGERLIDQVPGIALALVDAGMLPEQLRAYIQANPRAAELVDSHYKNYNTIIPMAQDIFSVLFGVRIRDGSDLDNLDYGVDAYYNWRGGYNKDVPLKAVERAVMLKQTYFPMRSYNAYQWDINKFKEYPLVAPVPGIKKLSLFQGTVPGGGLLIDGIPVEGGVFVPPYLNANPHPTGTDTSNTQPTTQPVNNQSAAGGKTNWGLIIGILALLGVGYVAVSPKPTRRKK